MSSNDPRESFQIKRSCPVVFKNSEIVPLLPGKVISVMVFDSVAAYSQKPNVKSCPPKSKAALSVICRPFCTDPVDEAVRLVAPNFT